VKIISSTNEIRMLVFNLVNIPAFAETVQVQLTSETAEAAVFEKLCTYTINIKKKRGRERESIDDV
jgi:hypothetical protein